MILLLRFDSTTKSVTCFGVVPRLFNLNRKAKSRKIYLITLFKFCLFSDNFAAKKQMENIANSLSLMILRIITSTDDNEIKNCLQMLKNTNAGTGLIHESFNKDDPAKFTRKWFAWANTLFGKMIPKLNNERLYLLKSDF